MLFNAPPPKVRNPGSDFSLFTLPAGRPKSEKSYQDFSLLKFFDFVEPATLKSEKTYQDFSLLKFLDFVKPVTLKSEKSYPDFSFLKFLDFV